MAETVETTTVPITRPSFGDEELRAVQQPIESGWVIQGPHVQRFEQLVAEFTGTPHAVATSSGTSALHVAVVALGVGPGDEVIVPSFTWISTANVIEYTGARPVFCDIDLATFNVDPEAVAAAVTSRTVGIIPVHLFGLSAELDPILEVARRHNLWVLEDAACALGAQYRGRQAGAIGDAGCFSFHPRKSLTTGEGGMVVTSRDDVASASRSLRDHGSSRQTLEGQAGAFLENEFALLGFNYRLTDIQGALGCAQMGRVDEILASRRRVAARYDEELSELDWLRPQAVPEGFVHAYQAYVCLYRPDEPTLATVAAVTARRSAFMAALRERGVSTRQGTHAACHQRYYVEKYGLRPEQFPNAYLAERLSVALPLFPSLTDAEQEHVVTAVRDVGP